MEATERLLLFDDVSIFLSSMLAPTVDLSPSLLFKVSFIFAFIFSFAFSAVSSTVPSRVVDRSSTIPSVTSVSDVVILLTLLPRVSS